MSRLILKSFISAAAIAGASLSFADGGTLAPVPEKVFAGCINGRVNIWVSKEGSFTNHWFQMRLPHEGEDAWRTVKFDYYRNYDAGLSYSAPAEFWGEALFRVAETNAAGLHAGFLSVGPLTNHVRHAGYWIGTSGNDYSTNIYDGVAATHNEANEYWSGTRNPWFGIAFHSDKVVGKVRYVPRQSALGQSRVAEDIVEMSNDAAFSDPVKVCRALPLKTPLGGVAEIVFDSPVTGRYFRIYHRALHDDYLSIAELEFSPSEFNEEISVSVVPDDCTNMWPAISWSIPRSGQCVSGVVERAVSPEGPFAQVSDWSEDVGNARHVDKAIPVGVKYYYRVKAHCIGGGIAGYVCSKAVSYVRSRRLERDPEDLTILRQGVSVYNSPFVLEANYEAASITYPIANAFDGKAETFPELCCYTNRPLYANVRSFNPVIGVDLGSGSAFHVAAALVYPRANNLQRARYMALYGANQSDLSDRVRISPVFGGFLATEWQYNLSTDLTGAFRYVFLFSPDDQATYGNVGEVGFYGFTDQDIIDSGVLVPPENVAASAKNTAVALSWSKAWNHGSYAIDRRREGEEEWTRIAFGLDAEALAYLDDDPSVRKGVYEYRVLAVAGENEVSSARARCAYSPKRGIVIVVQ